MLLHYHCVTSKSCISWDFHGQWFAMLTPVAAEPTGAMWLVSKMGCEIDWVNRDQTKGFSRQQTRFHQVSPALPSLTALLIFEEVRGPVVRTRDRRPSTAHLPCDAFGTGKCRR